MKNLTAGAAARAMVREVREAEAVALAAERKRDAEEAPALRAASRQRANNIANAVVATQRKAINALRKEVTGEPLAVKRRNLLALQAVETGLKLAMIGKEIGYAASTVGKWVNQARDERGDE